ncbi:MAG TPA: hypothetical protein VHL58_16210 [Thermoanaerobaculia bacterium]|nr:hypothetical protein [Thermoanaerobaculia bacterium]
MKGERYEKWGATLQRQKTRSGESILRLDEHGLALTSGSSFESQSLDGDPSKVDCSMTLPIIEALDDPDLRSCIERFTLTRGAALHRLQVEDGDRYWPTTHERLHISLVHHGHRVELNLSCEDHSEISSLIRHTARALTAAKPLGTGRIATASLMPAVAAQFWRVLVFSPAAAVLSQHALRLQQKPRQEGELDGNGAAVKVMDVVENPSWNVYRPSYRNRAVRLPLNVSVTIVGGEREAEEISFLAMTRGPELTLSGNLEATALCSDLSTGDFFVASMRISPADFCARIIAISDRLVWFPEMAGVFGSDTLLQEIELLPV